MSITTINKKTLRIRYILGDYLAANLAWLLLNIYRYDMIANRDFPSLKTYLFSSIELQLQFLIPVLWMILYYYSGYYNNPVHQDRVQEFKMTFVSCLFGALIIFFLAIIDDVPDTYITFYKMLSGSFLLQFSFTYGLRVFQTQRLMNLVHRREFGFKTLVIGAGKRASKLEEELENLPMGIGNLIEGYIDTGREPRVIEENKIIGNWEDIEQVITEREIKEIIVAPDSHDEKKLFELLKSLYKYNLPIKILAGKYSILSRAVKMTGVFSSPMIEITRDNMPEGQKNVKQTIDIVVSFVSLLFLSPLFLYLAWRVKKDSPGPVFYKQERIGYRGKKFTIIKFRTMRIDAESGGSPMLSSETDERITNFGKYMRKYRLDELPQFWNILKGEMSLVGPRPERKFYVDQIIKRAPYYCLIYNIKPGLTSWATVKNGYANTIEKMIDRLKYDIIYLESRTLAVDIKILFYTVKTLFTGEGM